jgi:type IV fimbrial biogenesis protein FimT
MALSDTPRFTQNRRRGFTLIEALTSLAIASILVTAAVPAMQDFIIRNRMSTEVNTFLGSLYLARSEAVKRLQKVSLCPIDPAGDCASGSQDWEQGWKVYYTDPATGNEVALEQDHALPSRFKNTGTTAYITFNSRGSSNAGSFSFTDTGGVAVSRCVTVSNAGRPYVYSGVCS